MELKAVKRFIVGSLLLAPISYAQLSGDGGSAAPEIGAQSAMPGEGRTEDWKNLLEQKELDKTTARPSFYAIFKSAQDDVMAGKLPKAEKNIKKLQEMENKNIYEQARVYLLEYWYAGKTGDKEKETAALESLVPIAVGNIDSPAFVEAGMRLFKRQYNAKDYGGALDTINYLRQDTNALSEINSLGMIPSKLDELAAGTQNISHDVKTDKSGIWSTKLLRSYFYLSKVTGEVKTVNFKCDNKTTSITYQTDSVMTIPEAWGKCTVNLAAAPESSYTFIQMANKPG